MSAGNVLQAEESDVWNQPTGEYDKELAQIQLDPELARTHPALTWVDAEKVESGIDAIYIAADAGSVLALGRVLRAAAHRVNELEANTAFNGETITLSEDDVYFEYTSEHVTAIRQNMPLTRDQAFAEIDESLTAIELALEDAQNQGYVPPAYLTD